MPQQKINIVEMCALLVVVLAMARSPVSSAMEQEKNQVGFNARFVEALVGIVVVFAKVLDDDNHL